MIGRANDRLKRFELGIQAMVYIMKEVPRCEMKIITDLKDINYLKILIKNLNLERNIKFIGFTPIVELYFKNSSLHIFPSISECFPMVLCETKIYGIPNILIGIDYVNMAKNGTVILYDDSPKSVSKEAIKILENENYRRKLGKEARNSMKKFKNKLLLKKWVKLILSIYNGENYYEKLRLTDKKMPKNKALNIIKKQINILKIRRKMTINFTINNLENFSFMENISYL